MATYKDYKCLVTHVERMQKALDEILRYADKLKPESKDNVKVPAKKRGRKKKSAA